ncbi:Protein LSM12, partial [Tinamus guttatus]
ECPSSSGKPNHADILLVNLQYVSEVEIINDRTETPPPLASLNVSKRGSVGTGWKRGRGARCCRGRPFARPFCAWRLPLCLSTRRCQPRLRPGGGRGAGARGPPTAHAASLPPAPQVEKHFRDVESQKVMQRSQAQQTQKETSLSS